MKVPEPAPAIAIIIPHYSDTDRLEICLTHLMANDLTGAEIVVVDNMSPTPPDRLRPLFPKVRFISEPDQGAGPTRNRGVAETTAPVLAFLDADCIPAPTWVATARRKAADADLIGGRVDVHDETPAPRSGAEAFEQVFAFRIQHYIEVQGVTVTANLVTHRAVFDQVGPFRTGVAEDTDWTQRAVAAGYRLIYCPDLTVSHPTRSDWTALARKWRRLTVEAYQLSMDQAAPSGMTARLRWAGKALAMPLSALVHLPKVLFSTRLNSTTDRLRGAATLLRLRLTRMVWMLGLMVKG